MSENMRLGIQNLENCKKIYSVTIQSYRNGSVSLAMSVH